MAVHFARRIHARLRLTQTNSDATNAIQSKWTFAMPDASHGVG